MSTEFRILKEQTFSFNGIKLYVMLLRENETFGVEVVNNKKTFGRKYTKDREGADLLFDMTVDKLCIYKSITEAENAIERCCFSLDSLDFTKLMLLFDGVIVTQSDIVKLKGKINFKTRVKFNYNRNKKKDNALTVYIYLGLNKKPVGVLTGTRKALDLVFELL